MRKKGSTGYILLEALLAVVVLSMVVLSVVPMLSFLLKRGARSRYEAQGALLLQEGTEIAYNILISDWDSYTADKAYHPGIASNEWALFDGAETELETLFTRSITLKRACRVDGDVQELDDSGNCSGPVDDGSRYVITKVSWLEEGEEKILTASLLLTNIK